MNEPLTRKTLDGLQCMAPGCDHADHSGEFILHGRCHPRVGTWVWYQHGVLTIRCKRCEAIICRVAVAA